MADHKSTIGQCLAAAGLTVPPSPLSFKNKAVGLNPLLWPIIFELHVKPEGVREDFSECNTGGRLRLSFERQVLKEHRAGGQLLSSASGRARRRGRTRRVAESVGLTLAQRN